MGWVSAELFLQSSLNDEPILDADYEPPKKRRIPYPEWWDDASCAGQTDDFFFGDSEDGEEKPLAIKLSDAKKICATCPVFELCLRNALGLGPEANREEYGIWAGTSTRQRKRIWEIMDSNDPEDVEQVIQNIIKNRDNTLSYSRRLTYTVVELIPLKEFKEVV